MVVEITQGNFEQIVLKSEKPVLLFFYGFFDGYKYKLLQIMENISEQYVDKAIVASVCFPLQYDFDQLLLKNEIKILPTIITLSNGKIIDKKLGVCSENYFTEILNKLI
jgi:thioredoxin 1